MIYSTAHSSRELHLLSAGVARGNRQALMRCARCCNDSTKAVLVESARRFQRDFLRYVKQVREAK